MNKPAGMSRKDYHRMKAIVKSFLNDSSVMVEFSDHSASGLKGENHDEGYNCSFIEVSLGDKPGTFSVRAESWGSDCDGRHSNQEEYTVAATAAKRKRYYMSRNWDTNRPIGKFGVKSQFKILNKGRSSQRDYTAESMGY